MEDKQGEVNGCKYWETGLKYVGMSFQIGGGHGQARCPRENVHKMPPLIISITNLKQYTNPDNLLA